MVLLYYYCYSIVVAVVVVILHLAYIIIMTFKEGLGLQLSRMLDWNSEKPEFTQHYMKQ